MTDKRVQTMNEFVTCIKLIKMYAWEKSFTKTIRGRKRTASGRAYLVGWLFLGSGGPEGD